MATVLVTGGTGLIGKHLCRQLQHKGYEVAILSRTQKSDSSIPNYTWIPEEMEIEKGALDKADYIIHLAGENIGDKRWTDKRKQQIIDSRVRTANLLLTKVREQNRNIKAFISASAIGYYGSLTSDKVFNETDSPAHDFLGDICDQWEQSIDGFKKLGIRTVTIRTGIVLTAPGGPLSRLSAPVKVRLCAAFGNGKQYMPWIHIEDLCGIYIKAIEDNQISGAYNAVAPDHKTNKEFIRTMAHVLGKSCWFPNIPALIFKLLLGKMSDLILKGSRVSAAKIKQAGYNFLFPDLESALKNLIGRSS